MENNELLTILTETLLNKKAQDITYIDIKSMTTIADGFLIATGRSVIQTKALCDEIEEVCKKKDIPLTAIEGYNSARWIVIDLNYILVHIFHHEDRDFYNIERLWSNTDNVTRYQSY